MKTLLIILAIIWPVINIFAVMNYMGGNFQGPIRFWRDYFSIRNVFGIIYSIIVFIVCLPSIVIWYLGYWLLVVLLGINYMGIRKEFKVGQESPDEEYDEDL